MAFILFENNVLDKVKPKFVLSIEWFFVNELHSCWGFEPWVSNKGIATFRLPCSANKIEEQGFFHDFDRETLVEFVTGVASNHVFVDGLEVAVLLLGSSFALVEGLEGGQVRVQKPLYALTIIQVKEMGVTHVDLECTHTYG